MKVIVITGASEGIGRDLARQIAVRDGAATALILAALGWPAVAAADVVFIAVGTPSRRGDGHADLSYVHAAAREIALVVLKFAARRRPVVLQTGADGVGKAEGAQVDACHWPGPCGGPSRS